jgi:hypothetical protein
MNHWLTTHWPPRANDLSHSPGGVWVVDGKEHVIRELEVGDLVWIYESGSGKTAIRTQANGQALKVPCKRGRQGVIALCQVTEPAYARDDATPEAYVDGTTMWWRWFAETETLNSSGFVPRSEVAVLLNYDTNYTFRGFGQVASGLKQLTAAQHDTLQHAFNASVLPQQNRRLAETARAGHGFGGEGALHKSLKELIGANPSAALHEDGLSLVKLEYPFATGDRIDVLLRDRFGRYVAVEVEPVCLEGEVCGPLQCMKYRAMLAYVLGVPLNEIRAILASPEIHSTVSDKCRTHNVEIAMLL